MVVSYHMHDITLRSLMKPFTCYGARCRFDNTCLIEIDEDRIRVNHYKKPHTGVEMNERQSHEGGPQFVFLLRSFACCIGGNLNFECCIGHRHVMQRKTQNKTCIWRTNFTTWWLKLWRKRVLPSKLKWCKLLYKILYGIYYVLVHLEWFVSIK